jgi:hypothetical protein
VGQSPPQAGAGPPSLGRKNWCACGRKAALSTPYKYVSRPESRPVPPFRPRRALRDRVVRIAQVSRPNAFVSRPVKKECPDRIFDARIVFTTKALSHKASRITWCLRDFVVNLRVLSCPVPLKRVSAPDFDRPASARRTAGDPFFPLVKKDLHHQQGHFLVTGADPFPGHAAAIENVSGRDSEPKTAWSSWCLRELGGENPVSLRWSSPRIVGAQRRE